MESKKFNGLTPDEIFDVQEYAMQAFAILDGNQLSYLGKMGALFTIISMIYLNENQGRLTKEEFVELFSEKLLVSLSVAERILGKAD